MENMVLEERTYSNLDLTYFYENFNEKTLSLQEANHAACSYFDFENLYSQYYASKVANICKGSIQYQNNQPLFVRANAVTASMSYQAAKWENNDLYTLSSLFLPKKNRVNSKSQDNFNKLRNAFEIEYDKHNNYLNVSKEVADRVFNNIANYIAELNFNTFYVELTKSNNIKFILSFPDKKLLMISKSFEPEKIDFDEDEIFFSFSVNRELVAANAAKISPFMEGFKKFLSM